MRNTPETPTPPSTAPRGPRGTLRLPSARASAVLAAVMLALGIAVGAAIGPAPDSSFAGGADGFVKRLPLLLASIAAGRHPAGAPQATASSGAATPAATPRVRRVRSKPAAAAVPTTPTPTPSSAEQPSPAPVTHGTNTKKLPPVTSVWLIELAGTSFTAALAQPSAAPYIDGQLIPAATLLSGWSALAGSTFAGEAALAEPTAAGATPPLVHSIVQPPCPEGAAGAPCAPETAGQLTAADEFLKTTLAQITTTPAYREHGLVVVTFASVAIAAQAGLPAGASTATLTAQPPAGVALLSPFARAGARPTAAFNPTSPRQSLQALLH
jgi:hypothetical protein